MRPEHPSDMHTLHYFVHIPKTAGVTVRTWLREVYERDEVIFVYDGKLREDPAAWSYPREELHRRAGELPAALRVLFGHYPFDTEALLHDRCRGVSMVRDPLARVLSWRRYVQKNAASLQDPLLLEVKQALDGGASLRAACEGAGGVAEVDNCIVRMFSNTTGPVGSVGPESVARAQEVVEQHFDYVGHTAWFEHSMQQIARLLGRPYRRIDSQNESAGGRSEQLLHDLGPDEDWLRANTRYDEQLVAWLRERFPPPDDAR